MEADFAALIAKFDKINGEGLKQAERKALKVVGKLVQDAIVAKAPVRTDGTPAGNALKPGALKADIKARVHISSDAKAAQGDTSYVSIGPGKATSHVARWVENGHANPKAVKGAKTTPAHPFVRPAADATKQASIDTYEAIMTAEIAKELNR
jgi:HK97 gp10 family phage protein